MFSERCIICKRKVQLYKAYQVYGKTGFCVRDVLVNMFNVTDDDLSEKSGICSECVCILNQYLFMHNTVQRLLKTRKIDEDVKYEQLLQRFIDNFIKINYDDSVLTDLLVPMRTVSVEEDELEYRQSLERSTRKRKRGHSWTKKKELRCRSASRTRSDSGVPCARQRSKSCCSRTPEDYVVLRYENGIVLNKRTRSVTRLLEQMTFDMEDEMDIATPS